MDPENTRDAHALWEAINQHSIVSMADPAGNISFVNDTFVRISGYSREELIGKTTECSRLTCKARRSGMPCGKRFRRGMSGGA